MQSPRVGGGTAAAAAAAAGLPEGEEPLTWDDVGEQFLERLYDDLERRREWQDANWDTVDPAVCTFM